MLITKQENAIFKNEDAGTSSRDATSKKAARSLLDRTYLISFLLALALHLLLFCSWSSLLERPENGLAKGLSGLEVTLAEDPQEKKKASSSPVKNRLLAELAHASEVQGVSGAQTRSVPEVLEDAIPTSAGMTFGATQQFAAAVELCKKSNVVDEKDAPIRPQKRPQKKASATLQAGSTLIPQQQSHSHQQSQSAFSSSPGALEATPSYIQNPQPLYPEEERRKGHEGRVLLRLAINAQGAITHLVIEHSSGYPVLDHQAVTTVEASWVFRPAYRHGQPISANVLIPIRFSLKK